MSTGVDVRIEWLDAPGVTSPELASTWARFEVWIGGRCVTQVESSDGTLRRSVYGSLYPLAEWIAANWWVLTSEIRPSAVEARFWSWANVRRQPWLRQHNLRGAGDGMAWPDLTVVTEGAVTRLNWSHDTDPSLTPVRFVSLGDARLPSTEVAESLARFVGEVLTRLSEQGLPKTRLSEEWDAVAKTPDQERPFCLAVAKLGLDPYAIDDRTAADVVRAFDHLPDDLIDDFFDSADPAGLSAAVVWAQRAMAAAGRAAAGAQEPLERLYEATSPAIGGTAADARRPWVTGYDMARRVRLELSSEATEPFDGSRWVGDATLSRPSLGLQGLAAVRDDRCGLVTARARTTAIGFARARALGRALVRPDGRSFILSAARGYEERVAGAFAAELLAPAEGIRRLLDDIGGQDDAALDVVAHHYRVSALLVRHQYENQLA